VAGGGGDGGDVVVKPTETSWPQRPPARRHPAGMVRPTSGDG